MSHWVCQICERPIIGDDGFVLIYNNNPDLARVGDHPRRATPELIRPHGLEDTISAGEIVSLITARLAAGPNINLKVAHVDCDPLPQDLAPYWFHTGRADTLEKWVGWVFHLMSKPWVGPTDLRRILAFWWMHKGENPPHAG